MNRIVELLINCYYDNMTVDQAVDFIKRCYSETPSQKQIDKAKEIIKSGNLVDWN